MSQRISDLQRENPDAKTREELLALIPDLLYEDGRTKQCFADDCDIDKIMTRFSVTGTISHLTKYEGLYGDFSDYDFVEQTRQLTRGREIFDALPAELRQEFNQSPAKFFAWVNDPANEEERVKKLTSLAQPGRQLPSADQEAAEAAASEPMASENNPKPSPAEGTIVPRAGSQED